MKINGKISQAEVELLVREHGLTALKVAKAQIKLERAKIAKNEARVASRLVKKALKNGTSGDNE